MSLNLSFLTAHSLSLFSKHFSHAIQPRIAVPPTLTSSVFQPASFNSDRTSFKSNSVLPPLRGLPLMANAYMLISLIFRLVKTDINLRSRHAASYTLAQYHSYRNRRFSLSRTHTAPKAKPILFSHPPLNSYRLSPISHMLNNHHLGLFRPPRGCRSKLSFIVPSEAVATSPIVSDGFRLFKEVSQIWCRCVLL
jgi:hypothetical protein